MNKKFAGRRNKNEKEKQDVGNDISRNKLQGITRRSKENFYRSNFRVVARVPSHRGGVKSPGVVSRRLVKASLRANTCVFTPSDVSRRLWTSSRGSQGRNNWNNHPLIPRLLPLLDRETESILPLEPGTRQRYHSLLPPSHPPPPFFLLSVSRRVLTSPAIHFAAFTIYASGISQQIPACAIRRFLHFPPCSFADSSGQDKKENTRQGILKVERIVSFQTIEFAIVRSKLSLYSFWEYFRVFSDRVIAKIHCHCDFEQSLFTDR